MNCFLWLCLQKLFKFYLNKGEKTPNLFLPKTLSEIVRYTTYSSAGILLKVWWPKQTKYNSKNNKKEQIDPKIYQHSMIKMRIKGRVSIDSVSTKANSQIQLWSLTFFNITGYFPMLREKVRFFE